MLNIYLDCADRAIAEDLLAQWRFAGVTTNPSMLRSAGLTSAGISDLVAWAVRAGAPRVFLQTWGSTRQEMLDRARRLRDIDERVVVKVPASSAGLGVARVLVDEGTSILVTAIYAGYQIVPAIVIAPTYVTPYLDGMQTAGRHGMDEVLSMQRALKASASRTRLLVAGVRTSQALLAIVEAGVTDITIPPSLWQDVLSNSHTEATAQVFERAGAQLQDTRI